MSERHPQAESELTEIVRSIEERAPQRLHDRIAALVAEAPLSAGGRSRPLARLDRRSGALAGAFAVVVLALAVVLSVTGTGTGSHGLTLREASALTLDPATMPAPSESARGRAQLSASVDGVSFPYWTERFGWRANGERRDTVDGRTVSTVFYVDSRGRRIGYAIVAGSPAPPVAGGTASWHGGTPYRVSSEHGAELVTWLRAGHLCVVSGRDVSASTLLLLATWDDRSVVS